MKVVAVACRNRVVVRESQTTNNVRRVHLSAQHFQHKHNNDAIDKPKIALHLRRQIRLVFLASAAGGGGLHGLEAILEGARRLETSGVRRAVLL